MANRQHFHEGQPDLPLDGVVYDDTLAPERYNDEAARAAELKEQLTGGSEDLPPDFFEEQKPPDPELEAEVEKILNDPMTKNYDRPAAFKLAKIRVRERNKNKKEEKHN